MHNRTQSSLSLADCRGIREYSGRRSHDFNGRAGRQKDYPREEERLVRIGVSYNEFGADDAQKELMVWSQPLGVDQESQQGAVRLLVRYDQSLYFPGVIGIITN